MHKIKQFSPNGKTAFQLATMSSTGTIHEMIQILNNGFEYGPRSFGGLRDHLVLDVQSDGLVVREKWGTFAAMDLGDWTLSIKTLTIGEKVSAHIEGSGPLLYRETPESPAEYDYFEKEISYTFEELEAEHLDELCLQDQITEIIDLTQKAILEQYS